MEKTPSSTTDAVHLQAAQEHLKLGHHAEAHLELEQISAEHREHPDTLEAAWEVCAQSGKWERALELAKRLREVAPDRQLGWMYHACSLAELKRTQGALEILLSAFEKFPTAPTIPYNLACLSCKLGRLKDASRWLAKAIEIGGRAEVKLMALDDDDLAPLLDEICAL
jgi:predicted Zn-dependent protease